MTDPLRHLRRSHLAALAALVASLCLPCAAREAGESPLGRLGASMQRAAALLRQGETGEEVAAVQEDIVGQLDALIALLEAQAGSGGRSLEGEGEPKSEKPSGATGLPLKPADESVLSPTGWTPGAMRPLRGTGDDWLPQLPAAEQRKVADTFSTGRLPPHYRELLRQYSKRLAEDAASSR